MLDKTPERYSYRGLKFTHLPTPVRAFHEFQRMVNYFYDDAYFSIDFNGEVFLASWANDSGESECQDDPKILVTAAKFNANYQWEKINNPNETNDDDQSPAPGN